MNAQDERRFRSTWKPELPTIDEQGSTRENTQQARTARFGSLLAAAVIAVIAFMAGLALGPRLQHGGQSAVVVSPSGPAPIQGSMPARTGARYDDGWAGAVLGSAAPRRSANGRHPRPEEIVRLPAQIQDQVARTVLTLAPLFSAAEILTLPWQIQEQVRQAPPGDVGQAPNAAVEPVSELVDFSVQKRWELADSLRWQAERAWQAGEYRAAAAFSRQSWAVMPDLPPLDAARAQQWAIADRLQREGDAAWQAGDVRHAASLYHQSQAVFSW